MKRIHFTLLLAASAILPSAATAGTRSSASYSVPADSTDAGGRAASSPNYTNAACIGGFGGVSTAVSPPETAKHGYIGQLYDIASLSVAATPITVLAEGCLLSALPDCS